MEKEIWKPIKNMETRYAVSNMGRIKSLPRKVDRGDCIITVRGRILKQRLNKKGYPIINLYYDGGLKTFTVHRLVGLAFLGENNDSLQIDHINANKTDNRVENLRFVTALENARNPITAKKVKDSHNSSEYLNKRKETLKNKGIAKKIHKYTTNDVYVKSYESVRDAARNINNSNAVNLNTIASRIRFVRDKTTLSAYGYKWYSKRIEPTQ